MRSEIETLLSDMPDYIEALKKAHSSRDYKPLQDRLDRLVASDNIMKPFDGEKGMKYYKPFHHAAVPKIIDALKKALSDGTLPSISLTFSEIDAVRKTLGFDSFGSAQDVLYGFSSERYSHWGPSLTEMGFRSACMAGQAEVVITFAPRYLKIAEPDVIITEVEGGITQDFWETANMIASNPTLNAIKSLLQYANSTEKEQIGTQFPPSTKVSGIAIQSFLNRVLDSNALTKPELAKAVLLLNELNLELARSSPKIKSIFQSDLEMSQEQIGLKYADEGKYVQKLLGGKRVEHLQSNVKMIKNPLRGNKCEVDSIYRVLSEKRLVLLEAKGKGKVSRSQLYQLYETFRLKIPNDWELTVVVLLLTKAGSAIVDPDVTNVIDLVEVYFDDKVFGEVTESLAAVRPKLHYRWLIKRPQAVA